MVIITPDSKEHWLELRTKDITSTEVSALFGLNPYMTMYELWHTKKEGSVGSFKENERMLWGNRLEAAIAAGIASDNDWYIEPFKDYGRDVKLRAGSSFDFKIVKNINNPELDDEHGLLEIKNVDSLQFRNKWVIENGEVVEAPPWIELQCQHQLMVSGYKFLYIGALVGGNTVALIKRSRQENIINRMRIKIEKFWQTIRAGNPPLPSFEEDAGFITDLYSSVEEGKVIDSTVEIRVLAQKYKEISEQVKKFEKRKQAIKAEILINIGDAEKVLDTEFSISTKKTAEKEIPTYTRKGYRTFRLAYKNKEIQV